MARKSKASPETLKKGNQGPNAAIGLPWLVWGSCLVVAGSVLVGFLVGVVPRSLPKRASEEATSYSVTPPSDPRDQEATHGRPLREKVVREDCLQLSRSLKPWATSGEAANQFLWSLVSAAVGDHVAVAPGRALQLNDGYDDLVSGDRGVVVASPGEDGFGTIEVEFFPKPGMDSPLLIAVPLDSVVIIPAESSTKSRGADSHAWQIVGGLELAQHRMPVLTQRDFLTPTEIAASLLALSNVTAWEESEHSAVGLDAEESEKTGKLRRSGSQTWWCAIGCQEEYTALGLLTARLSKQLGIDKSYFEYLQFVRYKEGGFYGVHSDHAQLTAYNPRALTFLVYLQGPEDGSGSTDFPNLGLGIAPKPGVALLWRNIGNALQANGLPTSEDMAVHESVVSNHVKIVVNVWVRMYPFEVMLDKDC